MRVLEVLGRSAGGIARHVAQVQRGLSDRPGFTVEIAGPSDLPEQMPAPFHPVDIPDGLSGHRGAIAELASIGKGFDLLHGHGLRAGIDAALAARRLKVPSCATVHNLVRREIAGPIKAPFYAQAERLVVRLNERVFCVSEEIANHLRERVPSSLEERIEVAYLGVEPPAPPRRSSDDMRAELGVSSDTWIVVTVARLAPQKALHVMFDAVAPLPGAHLVVLGDGPLRDELEDLGRSALGSRLHLLGYRPDVSDFVAAADVFCLSSVWEGVPLSVMEAILLGTPVVSTDVGGMREIITDGKSGRLVPSGNPRALTEALEDVLRDPGTTARFIGAARGRVESRFSVDAMLDRLAAAYGGFDA